MQGPVRLEGGSSLAILVGTLSMMGASAALLHNEVTPLPPHPLKLMVSTSASSCRALLRVKEVADGQTWTSSAGILGPQYARGGTWSGPESSSFPPQMDSKQLDPFASRETS
ncbi:uncharacterized protein K444DRAFT_360747 [Hyaloscypha bicolor E]|uniref:Uncharacterized protein n=1 Tax=Hyaloscypha bicolor E TaxID=1095630 RepID=A0A2J6TGE2_9HELO|nr:uncharacterized protein K444DRAFT_360747 [Hyaloscypha bicolor E]PMD62018.1 hypothetical protein K444DRAFT_360747 [Hyaloscypha bicolor E]